MKQEGLNILLYRWKAYNYLDVYQTFITLGHTVDIIEQDLTNYDEDPVFEQRLVNQLHTKEYDCVFTMNYFALISTVCQFCKVKYVIWTCDNPLISMYHKTIYNSCNYIFTFDKTNYIEFKGMGVEHIWYLPLAVDIKRLDYTLDHAKDLKAYENEIAFVGSLYERNTYDKLQETLPDFLKGYFEAVMQAQMCLSGANIIEEMLTEDILEQLQEYFQLKKSKDSFSDLGLIFSTTVLGFKIASIQRRKALIALSKHFPVTIYTNSNTADLLHINYRGSVDYWTEMPKVFRASKINLNFTIPNIKSGIPLRMWDIMGAGGFLMTNYQAEIPLYLKEGTDLVCFEDERDLVEKTHYYLAHEEDRKEIAGNGYKRVKEKHSYLQRITEMLNIVFTE